MMGQDGAERPLQEAMHDVPTRRLLVGLDEDHAGDDEGGILLPQVQEAPGVRIARELTRQAAPHAHSPSHFPSTHRAKPVNRVRL